MWSVLNYSRFCSNAINLIYSFNINPNISSKTFNTADHKRQQSKPWPFHENHNTPKRHNAIQKNKKTKMRLVHSLKILNRDKIQSHWAKKRMHLLCRSEIEKDREPICSAAVENQDTEILKQELNISNCGKLCWWISNSLYFEFRFTSSLSKCIESVYGARKQIR